MLPPRTRTLERHGIQQLMRVWRFVARRNLFTSMGTATDVYPPYGCRMGLLSGFSPILRSIERRGKCRLRTESPETCAMIRRSTTAIVSWNPEPALPLDRLDKAIGGGGAASNGTGTAITCLVLMDTRCACVHGWRYSLWRTDELPSRIRSGSNGLEGHRRGKRARRWWIPSTRNLLTGSE